MAKQPPHSLPPILVRPRLLFSSVAKANASLIAGIRSTTISSVSFFSCRGGRRMWRRHDLHRSLHPATASHFSAVSLNRRCLRVAAQRWRAVSTHLFRFERTSFCTGDVLHLHAAGKLLPHQTDAGRIGDAPHHITPHHLSLTRLRITLLRTKQHFPFYACFLKTLRQSHWLCCMALGVEVGNWDLPHISSCT